MWLRVEAYALTANGRSNFFWNLSDFLIPNERGLIDVSLLTLPYVQNYGWAITELEMTMMYTSCEDHVYGWKDWRGCHVWGCKRSFGRDPVQKGRAENGKHTPGDWEGQVKKCTVCGYVTTKDTTPPVIEGVVNGWDYTADDNDDGTFGTIDFTVRDPAAEGETVSGIQSVTINSEKQSVQSGQVYQLSAPDGGNGDEGLWYEIVVTDKAGNSTTAKVRVYRRHRVLFVEDRNLTRYIELGVPHGFDLDFPFSLPKEAYFVDLDDESIRVCYDEENKKTILVDTPFEWNNPISFDTEGRTKGKVCGMRLGWLPEGWGTGYTQTAYDVIAQRDAEQAQSLPQDERELVVYTYDLFAVQDVRKDYSVQCMSANTVAGCDFLCGGTRTEITKQGTIGPYDASWVETHWQRSSPGSDAPEEWTTQMLLLYDREKLCVVIISAGWDDAERIAANLEIVETSVDTPQPDLTNGRGFRWIGGVG